MVYLVQNVQKCRRYKKFEVYVEISTGTTISQEMLKQTVNKNNIHVPLGVSQVSQLKAQRVKGQQGRHLSSLKHFL